MDDKALAGARASERRITHEPKLEFSLSLPKITDSLFLAGNKLPSSSASRLILMVLAIILFPVSQKMPLIDRNEV